MKTTIRHLFLILLLALFTIVLQNTVAGQSACYNSDFSNLNFANWTGYTSVYPTNTPGTNVSVPYYYTQGIVPGRHTIITTATPDPFTANNVLTLPPGEKYAVRLGNGGIGTWGDGVKWQRDYLEYTVTVTPTSNLLVYKYAVVLQDPNKDPSVAPHPHELRPRFIMSIRDAQGNPIDKTCGNHEVFVDSVMDGFRECKETVYKSLGAKTLNGGSTMYRAWTSVGVDLRSYIGSNVTIRFETWDCGLGGHFGYAYLMAKCDSLSLHADVCNANGSVTVTAPDGFAYDWLPKHQSTQTVTLNGLKDGDTVRVLLTSTMGCQTEAYTIVHPAVTTAQYNMNKSVICVNDTIQFTESSFSHYAGNNKPISITNWNWNFGDGTSSTLKNPEHSYSTKGSYLIKLTVTNQNGCSDTLSQLINVMPPPTANFVATDACVQSAVSYMDASVTSYGTITSWKWDFGDTSTSTLQNPNMHTYLNAGVKQIKLHITNSLGCSHDTTHSINIWAKPQADFTTTIVCLGDTTFYTDKSKANTPGEYLTAWTWSFGDNYPIAIGKKQYHTYLSADTFVVTLEVTSNKGCKEQIKKTAFVNKLPIAEFTFNSACTNAPIKFTDKSTSSAIISNWKWNFGDGLFSGSTDQNPEYQYSSDGSYNVSLLITDANGCSNNIRKQLTLHPLPTVNFNSDKYNGCAPLTINFKDLSTTSNDSIIKFAWNLGDNGFSSSKDPNFIYKNAGVYSVSLDITTANNCKESYTWDKMIEAYPTPKSAFTPSAKEVSEANPIIYFSDNSSGSKKWWWTLGDGSADTITNPTHKYDAAGTYTVWQYVENEYGCRDSSTNEVKIIPEWSLFIPNAFSPNGDGKNDHFIAEAINVITYEMWIYDRWGNIIFNTKSLTIPWDGKVQDGTSNHVAQEDVYVWMIRYTDVLKKDHRETGHVTLIR